MKPLELELKKLEDLSDAIVQDFALMRKREEEMRDTNGKLLLNSSLMQQSQFNLKFKNQQITECCSSVFLECVVFLDWLLGKFFILDDSSKLRNSSNKSY